MTTTPILDQIATTGTGYMGRPVRLADGRVLSIAAGPNWYCRPRPGNIPALGDVPVDYAGPYTHLEVLAVGPWTLPDGRKQAEFMPVDDVRALVVGYGGEHADQDSFEPVRVLQGGESRG